MGRTPESWQCFPKFFRTFKGLPDGRESINSLMSQQQANAPLFTLKNVGPNVWAVIEPGGLSNSGFVVGDDGVVVIDSFVNVDAAGAFSLEGAQQVLAEIRKVTSQPVKFVVNTHYHMDHVSGNSVFVDAGAKIVGQRMMIWDNMSNSDVTTKLMPAPAEVIEWRRLNTVFTDVATTQPTNATLSGDGDPEELPARKATWNLFSVLGAQPMLGRVFSEDEDNKGAHVVVISHGLWQRRYGSAQDIIGRKISLNDQPYAVIGVMPRNFYFMPASDIDIWMPASFPAWMRRNFTWHDSQIVARLKSGITLDHARESMAALSRQVTAKDFRGPHPVIVNSLREEMTGKTQTALIVLLCAAAALLLIACFNLANLLMSRGAVRGREVAVRAALGAGRGRLVAQFLTESLVLAALGTVAGFALAVPAIRFLERLVPEAMGVRLAIDWRVLAFSAAAALAATLTFGLVPALRGSRAFPQTTLREVGRRAVS